MRKNVQAVLVYDEYSPETFIEKLKTINGDEINSRLQFLNSEFIRVYESEYRNLLKEIGSTFEILEVETMKEADGLLNFNVKTKSKFLNNKNKEK